MTQRATLAAYAAAVALCGAAYFVGPIEHFVSPGPPSTFHTQLACRDCHVDDGVATACVACHAGDLAGRHSTVGIERGKRCTDCHEEHTGAHTRSPHEPSSTCGDCHVESELTLSAAPMREPLGTDAVASLQPRYRENFASFSHTLHLAGSSDTTSCADCHTERTAGRYGPVTYETCVTCHDGTRAGVADLSVDRHGSGTGGVTCINCHSSVGSEELARQPVERRRNARFGVAKLTHAFVIGTDQCTRCHVEGARFLTGETMRRPFPHGMHLRTFPPSDDPAAQAQACAACHATTVAADDLVRLHAVDESACSTCHEGSLPQIVAFDESATDVDETRVRFPHPRHASLACTACHVFEGEQRWEARVTTPAGVRDCSTCHSGHANVGGGRCGACHDGAQQPLGQPRLRLRSEPRFDHDGSMHTTIVEDCRTCHVGIEASERIGDVPLPTRDATLCANCHVQMRAVVHW